MIFLILHVSIVCQSVSLSDEDTYARCYVSIDQTKHLFLS